MFNASVPSLWLCFTSAGWRPRPASIRTGGAAVEPLLIHSTLVPSRYYCIMSPDQPLLPPPPVLSPHPSHTSSLCVNLDRWGGGGVQVRPSGALCYSASRVKQLNLKQEATGGGILELRAAVAIRRQDVDHKYISSCFSFSFFLFLIYSFFHSFDTILIFFFLVTRTHTIQIIIFLFIYLGVSLFKLKKRRSLH